MKKLVTEALRERGIDLKDARICILGLAYLANSDDTRNSPALTLYNLLRDSCKEVVVHDPFVKKYKNVVLTNNLRDALKDKNCIVLVTSHKEYSGIELDELKELLSTPVIVDGRGVFDPEECEKAGYSFRGIGIGKRRRGDLRNEEN
jgi:UDP-N-acetyl-D-mannosaminuronic acid dehydrogenase